MVLIVETVITMNIPILSLEGFKFEVLNYETNLKTIYTVNHVITIVMNLRWILIFNMFLQFTDYYSMNMMKIMRLQRLPYSNMFIVKLFIKKKPILFFIFIFTTTVIMFSFMIRLCELPLAVANEDLGFESFMITLWMVIVTLTTVGYGDYSPKTMPGRFLGFILCLWGIIEISIIVVVLFELLILNYSESQALYLFNKLGQANKLNKKATQGIVQNLNIWNLEFGNIGDVLEN